MNNVTLQAQYTISAQSNQGMIRTNNEDNLLVVPLISESGVWSPTNSEDKYLQAFEVSIDSGKFGVILAVADGMGGANAGEVASKIAIDEISKARLSPGFDTRLTSDPMLVLKEILHQANASIIDFATQESSTKGMGTTLTLAFIGEKGGTVAWIGDSRAYLFRKKDGLKQISKDHSVVQELLDANQISEEIAFYHPE
ncbi:MAG: serine/threonine-protein phosphatase, partial [Bacteroidetes bacterium]|nr:serine/threonine-protein phosphatase [Bacteroidota bacterium]